MAIINFGGNDRNVDQLTDEQITTALRHTTIMDNTLREMLHSELAVVYPTPEQNRAWLRAYCARHMAKYGQLWCV